MGAVPRAAIRELLEYNWAGEERDYQLNPPDEPGQGHHIFERMQEIRDWLDGDMRQPPLGQPGNPAMFADDGDGYVTVLDGGYSPIEYEIPRARAERDYPEHRPYDELG